MGAPLLLRTNGLTKHVSESAISELLSQDTMADETWIRLLNQANDNGASDNITIVVARFLNLGNQNLARLIRLMSKRGIYQLWIKKNVTRFLPDSQTVKNRIQLGHCVIDRDERMVQNFYFIALRNAN